ncbi:hypothetical protein O6R05_08195 [Peptoniphilus equinus]|uniref:Uncharacterized protein n=1 Tax=Peptoniphilus equinus TaxID=3016343 RepID=A0ABY7QT47_9FIRM|nr:hypothetical protein [Peptoniphilus equinus]WBW49972.1 hypothetical protein O6R05_08195 [Peptoniphilus equinus]
MTFVAALLFFSYKVLADRNKVIHLELNNTSYVELLAYNDAKMTTVNERSALRDILLMINELSVAPVDINVAPVSDKFINIYDKAFRRTAIVKAGSHLKVGDNWYLMDDGSAKRFDKIFEEYNN